MSLGRIQSASNSMPRQRIYYFLAAAHRAHRPRLHVVGDIVDCAGVGAVAGERRFGDRCASRQTLAPRPAKSPAPAAAIARLMPSSADGGRELPVSRAAVVETSSASFSFDSMQPVVAEEIGRWEYRKATVASKTSSAVRMRVMKREGTINLVGCISRGLFDKLTEGPLGGDRYESFVFRSAHFHSASGARRRGALGRSRSFTVCQLFALTMICLRAELKAVFATTSLPCIAPVLVSTMHRVHAENIPGGCDTDHRAE